MRYRRKRKGKLLRLIGYTILSVVVFICSMLAWNYFKLDNTISDGSDVIEDGNTSEKIPPRDDDGDEEHEHNFWLAKVLQETTCDQDGVELWVCDCGKTQKEVTAQYGHIGILVKGSEATCSQAGVTDGVMCETCEKILLAQEEIPKLGHEYGSDGVCQNGGNNCPVLEENELPPVWLSDDPFCDDRYTIIP